MREFLINHNDRLFHLFYGPATCYPEEKIFNEVLRKMNVLLETTFVRAGIAYSRALY